MLRAKALGALGFASLFFFCFAGISAFGTAAADEVPPKALDGTYSVHDLFGLLDGEGWVRYGRRLFNPAQNRVDTLLTKDDENPFLREDYASYPDGTFSTDSSGPTGTFIYGGALAVQSNTANKDVDPFLSAGYRALRISVRRSAGAMNATFSGNYSYHALIALEGGAWRNLFGGAVSDGAGHFTLAVSGLQATQHTYQVASDGRTAIDTALSDLATVMGNGNLAFQSIDNEADTDPQIPERHRGLAVYVRRGTNRSVHDFVGEYRVHELRVVGSHAQAMGIGTLHTAGNGVFTGSITRNGVDQDFDGTIQVNASGTFYLNGHEEVEGTIAEGGQFAVLSKDGGAVTTKDAGEAWMQIWVRRDVPTDFVDTDGDGLSDTEEATLHTNPALFDTDGDSLADGSDPNPLVADNTLVPEPETLTFTAIQDAGSPDAKTVAISSALTPYYTWTAGTDADWLTATPTTGQGNAALTASVDTTGMQAADSPYSGVITITAPLMSNSPLTIPVTVNVGYPPPLLSIAPTALHFTAMEDFSEPDPVPVTVENLSPGPYTWQADTAASWITLSPLFADADGITNVGVAITGLSADDSPFTDTVHFTAPGGANNPQDLTVTLDLLPSRALNKAFPLYPSPTAQAEPAVAFDPAAERYAVAWVEDDQVYGSVLDLNALDLEAGTLLSIAAFGTASHPVVVPAPSEDAFWVIWQQQQGTAAANIFARRIGTETPGVPVGVFDIAAGAASEVDPTAVYNAERDEIAVAYAEDTDNGFDLHLARFAGSGGDLLADLVVDTSAGDQRDPQLTAAPDALHYLLTWTDFGTPAAGETALPPSVLRARRIDATLGTPVGDTVALPATSGNQVNASVAYDTTNAKWQVLFENRVGTASSGTLWLTTLSDALHAAGAVRMVGSATSEFTGPALAHAPAAEQSLLAWLDDAARPRRDSMQRLTGGGYWLGPAETFPNADLSQGAPVIAHNPVTGEFLLLWQDARGGLFNVYAMRISAGSTDQDGDGLPNDWELSYGLDALDPTGDNGANGDPDKDGQTNAQEYELGTDPTSPDSDGDGLPDWQEDLNGNGRIDVGETDPANPDTDGDGFNDGSEHFLGANPLSTASTPGTGIYRIDYKPFHEGETRDITVYFVAAADAAFTLSLNSPDVPGWAPPDGWQSSRTSAAAATVKRGSHSITTSFTAPSPVSTETAIQSFVFRLQNQAGFNETRTALVAIDPYTTADNALALAERFAPIVKLHRDETFLPMAVEDALSTATLHVGGGHALAGAPIPSDLALSRQYDAYLDLPGTTAESLSGAYSALGDDLVPTLYATVVDVPSESDGVRTVVQYHLCFFADTWGTTTISGQRHEGDWQIVQVVLDSNQDPVTITTTRQPLLALDSDLPGTATMPWSDAEVTDVTHPSVYAGWGGHSLYLHPGAARYVDGLEVSDGLGTWAVPAGVATDYPRTSDLAVVLLPRLTEAGARDWVAYTGRWGQPDFPQLPEDAATLHTTGGPRGPVFSSFNLEDGTHHPWLEPLVWADNAPADSPTMTTVTGALPDTLYGKTIVLADPRGRVYRTQADTDTGAFSLSVPSGMYTLSVVDGTLITGETWLASGRFAADADSSPALLFPAQGEQAALGNLQLSDEDALTGSDIYQNVDSDGDGVTDYTDPDDDNDGVPDASDDDRTGDGWNDAYQAQDIDGDGIVAYYDSDDDNDGIPDVTDEDRNNDGVNDADSPLDIDEDGFINAVDLDWDNDGWSNAEEEATNTDPYCPRDSFDQRLGDVNSDGRYDATDVQRIINMALLEEPYLPVADIDNSGRIDAVDIQHIINKVLGLSYYRAGC